MAKLQLLKVLLVILVVFAALTTGQQNQSGKKKGNQQVGRPNQKPRPNGQQQQAANVIKNKPPKKSKKPQKDQSQEDKPAKNKQQRLITKTIPELGRVRGRVVKSQWSGRLINQFVDIPYAQSPVGPLRFKAPVAVEPWEELKKAYRPHPGCPSIQDLHKYESLLKKNVDIEDCLRLTVNSKSLTGSAPVMVYIHGDFLYDGSSVEAPPGYLLEEDVVLVSVRYRLGPFGFLSTMSEEIPGNMAVHDVIMALQWIQTNIATFGGDASRVTLFGQVGGSALINILTMSPAVPEGLFHRVIYQSGSALSPAFITDNPIASSRDIARFAGCKAINKVEGINKCIRKLNTTALLDAFSAHGDAKASMGIGSYGGVQFVIGGPSGILPQHPGKLLASEEFKAYPTLGGSVKNGGTFILKDIYIDNFNETIIDDQLDGLGYINHIITQTNGADPTGAWRKYAEEEIFTAEEIKNGSFHTLVPGLIDMCSTIPFKNPVLLAMQANSKKLPNSTYLYTFDYEGEINRYNTNEDDVGDMPFELGVSLTDENLYLFPWPRNALLNSNRDIKVAQRMVAFWTSFAATGVPSAPGVPEWPPMTDETGPYIKIGKTIAIGDNYLDEYNVAVKEVRMGYNLANMEFFDSLVEINDDNKDKDGDGEDYEDVEEEGDDQEHGEGDEGRRSNYVVIAKKSKRTL